MIVRSRDDELSPAYELLEHTLAGARANDRPDLVRRLLAVQEELDALADRDGEAKAVEIAAREALRALDSLEADLGSRRAMLADPAHAPRLRAELASIKARSEQLAATAGNWQPLLDRSAASGGANLEFHLRARLAAVLAEAEQTINRGDPGSGREQLNGWLRHQLVREADATYRLLHADVSGVAGQVAGQLGLRAVHRVPAPRVVAPDLLVDALPYRPPAATAVPGPARLLSVLIPGFAVLAAALVAVYLLGVTLPVWLLIAVGAVGALAVTGVAVSGERKRRLARRRADALGVVRSIVGEFGVALGRQAHNAVGGLHQELRRATAASVVARFAAVAEELDAIQGAAETAARGPAELAAISEDLDTLTDLRGRAARLLESRSVPGLTLLAGLRLEEPVRAIA
ncbi:MAG: hypothetical protein QOI68_4517 [Pseudonocardiales bacterium]|nr:hypothetical protein [Pseudonocardiales bacterium]